VRRDVGRLAADVRGLWALICKNVSEASAGMVPVQGASVFKLRFTESRQKIGDLAAHVLGRAALAMSDLPGGLAQAVVTSWRPDHDAGVDDRGRLIPDPEEHPRRASLGLPKEPRWTSR